VSTTAPQTRHAVTAIIVAHDGARLLPGLVQALKAQTYPVEQTVGVDTASRDRSGAVLAELIGQDAVFGMERTAGYGEAVEVALRHATRRRSGLTDPGLPRVEWIWLLHDDCEPAPDALEQLLRAAGKDRTVVVVGPKVLDGQDRRTLREVGVSIDRAGRRVTGIDPGEIDQGQQDHKRAVLAVGSAGMLVRRDVWTRLGGFDPSLRLFRDDVDFCWRVQAAGLRVHVVPDAVLYHRELSARRRRPVAIGNARRLDRRNAVFVLAVNLPLLTMLRVVGGCIAGSLVRAFYFLLTKQLDLAAAYAFSVTGLFAHPIRLVRARRRRAAGLAEGYNAVRLFIPPARTLFKLAEKLAGFTSNGPPQVSHGRHQATQEESEEDAQFVDQQSVVRRIIKHPCVQLFTVLLLITLIAERRLLGTSPLGGGALVPAWGGAAALWHEYLAGFHAVSVGSTASAPPYLAVVAALGTVLGGQAWLAVDVLLLGCVPLAGLTAYLASRWVVAATPARVLLAASYALLPVATGAVAAGRLGTAVAFMLLPLIAVSAGRMLTTAPRQARRAAWATGLLIATSSAFAPFTWVLGVVFAVLALGARRWLIAVDPVNAAIVAVTPFFVLFPWSLHLLASPSAFLAEAGLSTPALTTHGLAPTALLALSPGGPGLPPVWVTLGFGLALLALAFPARRAGLVIAGWAAAVAGLLAAVVLSRVSVTPPAGGEPADGWPGVALALAALGLLLAAAPAAQWLATIIVPNEGGQLAAGPPSSSSRVRRVLACAVLAAAATAPLFVALYWVSDGVRGPVGSVDAPLLPAFVSASSTSDAQYRTLILRPDGTGLDYLVVRQGDPTLGEPELSIPAAAGAALSRQVSALGAPDGADAGDPGLVLGSFGIRWVMLPAPVDAVLAQRLDAALGLVALNKGPSYDLWQVAGPVGRARVVAGDGTTTVLTSGTVNLSGAAAPAAGGTLILAEPYGGWTATLNGQALKPVPAPVDGWAQGFVLPPGGGTISITRNNLARPLSLILELIATLAICLLALPGKRADPVEEAEALAALREARNGKRAVSPTRPRATRTAAADGPADAPASTAGSATRSLRAGGTGHRAVSGMDRLGFALKRRAGQAPPDEEPEPSVPAVPREQAPATATARDDEQLPKSAPPEAVITPGRTDREPLGRLDREPLGRLDQEPFGRLDRETAGQGRRAEESGSGGSSVAPWDMAGGEWGSPSRTGPADTWAADSPETEKFLTEAERRDASAWMNAPAWGEGPTRKGDSARKDDQTRRTGQQAAATESPAPGSSAREGSGPGPSLPDFLRQRTSAPESPVSGTRLPWETGPQPTWVPDSPAAAAPASESPVSEARPPWETGPRPTWVPDSPAPEAAASESPVSEARPPWETGSQRPPWESGPQPPVSPAGAQPLSRSRPAAPTGPLSVSRTGPLSAPPTGPRHASRTGAQPALPAAPPPGSATGPQPSPPTGPRHASRTGAQLALPAGPPPGSATGPKPTAPTGTQPTGTQPISPMGTQPVRLAPWESGDWGRAPDWDAMASGGDAFPAAPEPEPAPEAGLGSGAWPVASPSGKSERHSHRGGKHGKPSRWRGSGNRPSGDGEP
jgi:GT2 family glycosyltransferase